MVIVIYDCMGCSNIFIFSLIFAICCPLKDMKVVIKSGDEKRNFSKITNPPVIQALHCLLKDKKEMQPFGNGGANEHKRSQESSRENAANDEELVDTLFAISVVSKRLATKLKQENMEKEDNPSEQNE